MGTALHDSTCIFVGLSMTDADILRWLALRALDFASEAEQRTLRGLARTREGVRREVAARLRRQPKDRQVHEHFLEQSAL